MKFKDNYGLTSTGIVLVGVAGFVALILLLLFTARAACNADAENMGINTKWDAMSGCYYEIDGQYVPVDKYEFQQEVSR